VYQLHVSHCLVRINLYVSSVQYLLCVVVCPEGFTKSESANGCYKLSDPKAYADAGPACQQLDARAHLAIITSQEEMDAIDALIRDGQCYLMLYFGPLSG